MEGDHLTAPLLKSGSSEGLSRHDGPGEQQPAHEKLSIDNMLSKYVGEFGLSQLVHFVVVSLAWSLEGLQSLVMIFADKQPEWQCRPAVVSGMAFQSSVANSTDLLTSCSASSSLCNMEPSVWEWVGGKGVSTVSEWGLICGDEYKVGLAQSAYFLGAFVGVGMFGHFADSRAGRKGALFVASLGAGLAGLLTSTASNYWLYVGYRWLTGFTCSGIGLSCFVLATEPVGPSKRGPVGMSAFYFFSLGFMTLPCLAYFSVSWRHLYIITSLPALIYCAFILPTVRESPRWYVVQGRVAEAMVVLRAFASRNGKQIPEGVGLEIENQEDDDSPDVESRAQVDDGSESVKAASGNLWTVLKNPATRPRVLIMVVIWLVMSVVYYGISLNVANLGTNLYVGVFLNAVIECPAFAITAVLLERFGRRPMLASAMLLSGLSCLAGSFLFAETGGDSVHTGGNGLMSLRTQSYALGTQEQLSVGILLGGTAVEWFKVLRIVCSVVGIFGMAATYNLVYIYTAELFPTVVRNAALGLTSQAGGVGSIIAPVVVVVGRYSSALPFAIFGVMAIVGSALSLGLPETLNRPIFETLEGLDKAESEVNR